MVVPFIRSFTENISFKFCELDFQSQRFIDISKSFCLASTYNHFASSSLFAPVIRLSTYMSLLISILNWSFVDSR